MWNKPSMDWASSETLKKIDAEISKMRSEKPKAGPRVISVEGNQFGHYIVSNSIDDRTVYVQLDYDFCGLALTFGWIPCTECSFTDGTVKCAHHSVGEMIQSAIEFLDGYPDPVEDPGYFDGED
jgi:hypothetical protein